MGEGGEIDGVLRYAGFEVFADLKRDLYADSFLGLGGGAGDVGSEDGVLDCGKGGVFRRLLVEDVEGSAGNLAAS